MEKKTNQQEAPVKEGEETVETVAEEQAQTDGNEDNRTENTKQEAELTEREKQLMSELEEWKQKAEENYNRFLRSQADMDNMRRRVQKEKEEAAKYRSQSLAEALLPAFDNFERAMAAGKDTENVESLVKGLDMVLRQMQQAFEQEGIEAIEAVGKPFDPNVHEAVEQVESDEHESGIVVEELQKGYKLRDRVIRPSLVKVSS